MMTSNASAVPATALGAPLHIGAVGLIVRDLDRLTAFYSDLLGLTVQRRTPQTVALGVDGVPLLELTHRPDALPDDPREAGLYHTAFLMPTRADLGRWLLHAGQRLVPLSGASDHGVSEAIYLDDPEGNGIEVYADRPPETWGRDGTSILQRTDPLDIDSLLRAIGPGAASYDGAPSGLRVGHVHLRVGDVTGAEAFYRQVLGLDVTAQRTGALFMSTGGYHHHVATNAWHSRGAGPRNSDRAGLDWVALEAKEPAAVEALKARFAAAGMPITPFPGGFAVNDPWGTQIRLAAAA